MLKPWTKTLLWIGSGIALLAIYTICAFWISGFNFGLPPNPPTYGVANLRFTPPPAPPSPQALDNVKGCNGTPIAGNSLIVTCDNGAVRTVVTLAGIRTLPASHALGEEAKKVLGLAVDGTKDMTCNGARPSGTTCYIGPSNSFDLRLPLVEAGLAAVDTETESAVSILKGAQDRAKAARLGLWWDWPSEAASDVDPILWRMGRDATLGSAETTQVYRAQAFATFFSAAVAGFLGFVGGFVTNRHREDSRRVSREKIAKKRRGDIEASINRSVQNLLEYSELANMGPGFLLSWRNFDAAYAELVAYHQAVTNDISVGKTDDVRSGEGIDEWRDSLQWAVNLHRLVSALISSLAESSAQPTEGASAEVQKQVANYIREYWKRR